MDKLQRIGDEEELLRTVLDGRQASIWTAIPGIVQSFDANKSTCSVQPSIKGRLRQPDGTVKSINMPVLLDCPVLWQGGGGCTLTFPVKQGDECLVILASRCIDSWWQLGGVQDQAELRMHNLSDGFALVGVRSLPRAFSVSTSAVQLRTDDGAAYIEISPSTHKIHAQTSGDIEADAGGSITAVAGGTLTATSAGNMSLTAPTITLNAPNIVLNGAVQQGQGSNGGDMKMQGPMHVVDKIISDTDVIAAGVSGKTHTHHENGAGSNTNPPN